MINSPENEYESIRHELARLFFVTLFQEAEEDCQLILPPRGDTEGIHQISNAILESYFAHGVMSRCPAAELFKINSIQEQIWNGIECRNDYYLGGCTNGIYTLDPAVDIFLNAMFEKIARATDHKQFQMALEDLNGLCVTKTLRWRLSEASILSKVERSYELIQILAHTSHER